ncbi:pyridoxamine 5'-phosphate oxidase [Pseudovirgaria hyperparasitica]|uniref:pyridoxal 5'-phosphate synthase n=1 Tax=Pseudovirgaria hyperparasitica TaxID=470096 RepID=A0A6A6VW45_9PEZI|nr:pyridoxamine 5'-phosphate oxidase [Pseudovirgaria hyperparasitica]KAF2754463.1 pyridoxamine 5'-phosphate oxidase [Pseudovirgaria hyperparasitica]
MRSLLRLSKRTHIPPPRTHPPNLSINTRINPSPLQKMNSSTDTPSTSTTTTTPQKRIFAPATGISPNTPNTAPQAAQYTQSTLSLTSLSADPLAQFHTWFEHAQSHAVHQPETVTLATASLPSGAVSARMVYLKELDSRGFVVYSNWATSRKAADVASNPQASLVFWWREVERQVRVEGPTERLTREESQVYFDTRVRGSRVGAWASAQSEVLGGGREELEGRVREVEERFEGCDRIPVPEFWGGLRVVPRMVEFWQGRESRLHDRFRYVRESEEGEWKVERLSP